MENLGAERVKMEPGTGQEDAERFHPFQLFSAPFAGVTDKQDNQAKKLIKKWSMVMLFR